MAMFPALMNDTMFSDLFDDPFFEGWRNTDNTMSAVMPANMMTTDVRETDKGYDVDIDMPGFNQDAPNRVRPQKRLARKRPADVSRSRASMLPLAEFAGTCNHAPVGRGI